MELTKNFTVEELSVTDTGIHNTPGVQELEKLLFLATYILQPLREFCGRIKVNSGFRCKQVNDAIGGAATSQHVSGEAADINTLDMPIDKVFLWARYNLHYGQLILEEKKGVRWIHISLPRVAKQNMQAMTYVDGVYKNA